MRSTSFFIVIIFILIIVHFINFKDIQYWVKKNHWIPLHYGYLIISITFFTSLWLFVRKNHIEWKPMLLLFIFLWIIANTGYFLFVTIDWLMRLSIFSIQKITTPEVANYEGISRIAFLRWLGIGIGGLTSGSLIYGTFNKYKYHINYVKLKFPNLPKNFDGFRFVQISDIHCGSFSIADKTKIEKGIQMILDTKPEMIVFTGDLINTDAQEVTIWMDTFKKLKAPLGVYSILGNHDYGWYKQWENEIEKQGNFNRLLDIQQKMQFQLLRNEHVFLKKGMDTIALIGIENISAKSHYPHFGDLAKATENIPDNCFKILLSHDPSYWRYKITKDYKNISLTLSGHTHGAQYTLENPLFTWSPIKYAYKEWKGLYTEQNQYLYVNTGFGFLGYAGRVGVLPEITCFELTR